MSDLIAASQVASTYSHPFHSFIKIKHLSNKFSFFIKEKIVELTITPKCFPEPSMVLNQAPC